MSQSSQLVVLMMVFVLTIVGVTLIAAFRIERAVAAVGARYEMVFQALKAEILDEVRRETNQHLDRTRALVVEHSELEALIDLIRTHQPDERGFPTPSRSRPVRTV